MHKKLQQNKKITQLIKLTRLRKNISQIALFEATNEYNLALSELNLAEENHKNLKKNF